MTEDINIRNYEEEDKNECQHLWRELTEHHREIYNDRSIGGNDPGRFFDDHLEQFGPKRIWVAEKYEEIIGMVGLIGEGKEMEIEPIIVKHEHRENGIGKKLLQFVIQKAKKQGVRILNIRPVMRNVQAIKAFYSMGFQNFGHIELFMDLKADKSREWKSDLFIFGMKFNY